MARKQNGGGFNKFLNLIGLVDDQPQRDSYQDDYSSESYGRPATYVPSRQRAERNDTRRPAARTRAIPAQAGRSNYGSQRAYGSNEPRQRRASFENDYNSEFTNPTAPRMAARSRSRFEEEDESARSELPVPVNRQPAHGAAQRTVMFSLANLRDANKVITALVKGNTIVMTIETDDPRLRERIVDTLSGAVFALDASIRKATEQTYLLAPKSVNVHSAYEVDDRF